MKIYGLAGFPLTHSFSKKYFTEKFIREGLRDCSYENFELNDIRELSRIISENPFICGFNVTIPYKEKVMDILDEVDETAAVIGAVNTIKVNRSKNNLCIKGYNTDFIGFEKSIKPLIKSYHKKALILGTGGSSTAVAFVFGKIGIDFRKVSRLKSEVDLHYDEITPEMLQDFQIIINCTPLGMFPAIDKFPQLPYQSLTEQHFLFDLVYNPAVSVFLQKGKESGTTIKNGYEMLCIQADEAWKIWNQTL